MISPKPNYPFKTPPLATTTLGLQHVNLGRPQSVTQVSQQLREIHTSVIPTLQMRNRTSLSFSFLPKVMQPARRGVRTEPLNVEFMPYCHSYKAIGGTTLLLSFHRIYI